MRRRHISCGLNWDALFERSRTEGVLYPFYQNVPEDIRRNHRKLYLSYLAQGVHDLDTIHKILAKLDETGVGALILKGLSVDAVIYDDGFYRPRADVDLVVKEKDWPLFEKAVRTLGYLPIAEEKKHPILESLYSRVYVSQDDPTLPIHLHRRMVNNLYLLVGGFIEISPETTWKETLPFGQYRSIVCFSPEMQLVYLCEHALKHDYDELALLYEIYRLLDVYRSINWDKVIELARILGFTRFVYYSLLFASKIFSAKVPNKVLDSFRPKKLALSERMFASSVLRYERKSHAAYCVYVAEQKGLLNKISFIFRTIFPPQFTFVETIRRRFSRG